MKTISLLLVALVVFDIPGLPQDTSRDDIWRRPPRRYRESNIAPVDLTNTPRLRQLLRAGNIYLSLSDAIALAIENNLDIELQRYDHQMADAELLRAKGGGLLRGLTYTLAEAPVGVGGPASPLVTSAAVP